MSNHTTVLGKIEVPLYLEWESADRLNQRALNALPLEDSWPRLSRAMFAVTPVSQSYDHQVYHFAATLKGVEEAWGECLGKFEALLRRMSWLSANVYLETEYFGNHAYWWVATPYKPGEAVDAWERGGGTWTYKEFLESNQAVPSQTHCRVMSLA
jgi:hypothetical protein